MVWGRIGYVVYEISSGVVDAWRLDISESDSDQPDSNPATCPNDLQDGSNDLDKPGLCDFLNIREVKDEYQLEDRILSCAPIKDTVSPEFRDICRKSIPPESHDDCARILSAIDLSNEKSLCGFVMLEACCAHLVRGVSAVIKDATFEALYFDDI